MNFAVESADEGDDSSDSSGGSKDLPDNCAIANTANVANAVNANAIGSSTVDLKQVMQGLSLVPMVPVPDKVSDNVPDKIRRRIVVIGAGISGLRTATVLRSHGLDVTIVEARDRIGGRMYTKHRPGKPPREIGAAWMHETAQNQLVPLVPRLGLKYYYDDGAPLYYTPFGRSGSQFKAKKVADEFADYCEWFYTKNPQAPDRSAQEFIAEYVRDHPLLTEEERMWAPQALREMELWTALNSDLGSSKHLSYYITERNLYITGGYDRIVHHMAKPLQDVIHLQKEVSAIEHNAQGVVVRGLDLVSGEALEVVGDYVVVTTPLGALKRHSIEFLPPLPSAYEAALDKYSYSSLGKVFLEFEEIFWPKDNDQFIFYPAPQALAEAEEEDDEVFKYAFVISNLWLYAGVKELCIQTSDPLTLQIERMTTDQVYEFFKPLLKKIRSEPSRGLPTLVGLETTHWSQDKYAGYGAYSSLRVGDDPDLFVDFLHQNRSSRVQFAGEHCAVLGNGCVHGAFGTGDVAAKNILDALGIEYSGDSPVASPDRF